LTFFLFSANAEDKKQEKREPLVENLLEEIPVPEEAEKKTDLITSSPVKPTNLWLELLLPGTTLGSTRQLK
jgi:hypothetical protein